MDQALVNVVGQQDPGLCRLLGVPSLQQVGLFLQLNLIGLLGIAPGGVSPALDLGEGAVIHGGAVCPKEDRLAFGLVFLVLLHPAPVLSRVGAGQVEAAQPRRDHNVQLQPLAPPGEGDGIDPVCRGRRIQSRQVKGDPAGHHQLVSPAAMVMALPSKVRASWCRSAEDGRKGRLRPPPSAHGWRPPLLRCWPDRSN